MNAGGALLARSASGLTIGHRSQAGNAFYGAEKNLETKKRSAVQGSPRFRQPTLLRTSAAVSRLAAGSFGSTGLSDAPRWCAAGCIARYVGADEQEAGFFVRDRTVLRAAGMTNRSPGSRSMLPERSWIVSLTYRWAKAIGIGATAAAAKSGQLMIRSRAGGSRNRECMGQTRLAAASRRPRFSC